MKNIFWALHSVMSVFANHVVAADSEVLDNFRPARCLSQCELAGDCELKEFNEFPDFDTTRMEIVSNCPANYLCAVEGACSDGRKLLATSGGFTSEIRFYTTNGEFEGLITQPDVSMSPVCGRASGHDICSVKRQQ